MYYNKNLKSLLFDLRSDVNYTAWVIIDILKIFNCRNKNNSFKDYRKISFIMQFIFRDIETGTLIKFLMHEKLNVYELQSISSCYFSSKMEDSTVNAAIVLLKNRRIVEFSKTLKASNIYITSSEWVDKYPLLESIENNLCELLEVKNKLYKLNYDTIVRDINELREGVINE